MSQCHKSPSPELHPGGLQIIPVAALKTYWIQEAFGAFLERSTNDIVSLLNIFCTFKCLNVTTSCWVLLKWMALVCWFFKSPFWHPAPKKTNKKKLQNIIRNPTSHHSFVFVEQISSSPIVVPPYPSVLWGGESEGGGDTEDLRQHIAQLVEHLIWNSLPTQRRHTET